MTPRARTRVGAGLIAIVGDVHSAWSPADVAYFNDSRYALILVTGDLGGREARDGLSVARSIAGLTRRTLVMPGNNEVADYARIAAELTYRQARVALLGERSGGGVRTCGYSTHAVRAGALDVTVIAARPFAMGGCELSFPDALGRSFGVSTFEASVERLRALIDAAATEHLVFFAHNGPLGLGSEPDALWGRDFDPAAGDWGDRDLRDAIDYAIARGRKPLAVVAGHMHWRLRSGGQRRWCAEKDGVLYVNAARVPRLYRAGTQRLRHHVALELSATGAEAREVLVPDGPSYSDSE